MPLCSYAVMNLEQTFNKFNLITLIHLHIHISYIRLPRHIKRILNAHYLSSSNLTQTQKCKSDKTCHYLRVCTIKIINVIQT